MVAEVHSGVILRVELLKPLLQGANAGGMESVDYAAADIGRDIGLRVESVDDGIDIHHRSAAKYGAGRGVEKGREQSEDLLLEA